LGEADFIESKMFDFNDISSRPSALLRTAQRHYEKLRLAAQKTHKN
jgi:hypothetical protein